MDILVIASLALSGIILGLFIVWAPKLLARPEPDQKWLGALHDLESRMERLEIKWHGTLAELQERLERGTDQYRKARQAETYARNDALAEGGEAEPEGDETQEVLPFDEAGSDPRGLSYVPEALGGSPEPPWKDVAKQLAQSIASRGVN